jgi:aminoglycoside 2''-phosphotransferase
MHREMRLLPALAEHVSFRVPVPLVCAEDWFVYEKIPGRPLTRDDDIDGALAMIEELHTFPIDRAKRLLDPPPWPEKLASEWAVFEAEVFPLLEPAVVEDLEAVREVPSPSLALIHDDLGAEHLLVDDGGAPVGIIDFEDATVGDPHGDLLPTYVLAGRPLSDRMWALRCRGTLHALVYYVREGLVDEVPGAVAELRRRLDRSEGQ